MEPLQLRELTRRPSGISQSDQFEYIEDGLGSTRGNSSQSPEDVPEALAGKLPLPSLLLHLVSQPWIQTNFFPSPKKKPTR